MTEELLSNSVAAQVLCDLLPDKTLDQWMLWLQNNRNQARRVSHRIPFVRMAGGVFYHREELLKFAEFEKSRQLGTIKLTGRAAEVVRAFGIGENGSTAHGRQWKGGTAYLQNDAGKTLVQTTIKEPLMVFAMTPEQAIEFGAELIEAGQAAARINAPESKAPDLHAYKITTDNADMVVMRKEKQ